ncbi:MAG: phage major capsid protein [Pseudomonadota bacterium]
MPQTPDHAAMPLVADIPTSGDVVAAYEDFVRAFESFKDANDERLTQIETQVGSDVVTEEKVRRINRALDEQKRVLDTLVTKGSRPALAGGSSLNPRQAEHKSAFDHYVRRGDASRISRLEEKALSAGSGPDGGYLVPDQTETEILSRMAEISPMRQISSVQQVTGSIYKKPFSTTGPTTGWVGETDARTETTSQVLDEMEFPVAELYAMPAATQTILDDAAIDMDAWLAEEVRVAFAEQEASSFIAGSGVKRPKGILNYAKSANSAWIWGKVGYVATGAAGAFDSTAPGDALLDLIYSLKAGYRQNAHFIMSRQTQAEIRKIKDADGNYLWQPSPQAGGQATLFNVGIVESEDMPAIASDSFSIAFGDFRRAYLIVDRVGVRILRDPYTAKPYVLFYTTKRVGGGVQDFDAFKLLKFGAS